MSERKETIERKMQRAEEKRQMQIKQIVRKAHEEEAKVMPQPNIIQRRIINIFCCVFVLCFTYCTKCDS